MSMTRNWILAATCLLAVLMIPGSISAAAFPKQQTGLSAYLISISPNVAVEAGLSNGDKSTRASQLRFDPLLLKLAREGMVQNIRLMGDGTASVLAGSSAVREFQARGSNLTPAAPVVRSDRTLPGIISGVVSVSGGAGIGGATVSAFLGTTVVTATTATSGTYSLSLPSDGDYQVGVSAAGYEWQPAVMVKVPSTANDVNFSLVPQNLMIRGRITNQVNNAMPGIQVYATDLVYDNFTAGDFTTTDASGNYTLTVSAATYEVRAFAPPYGAKSRTVSVPPASNNRNFTFDTSGIVYTIGGVARTSSGAPLPGAEITFFANNIPFSSCDSRYANLAVAGADGRYSVTLPAGSYQTYTNWPNEWADHWVIASSDVVTITTNNNALDRTLPAVGTIRGVVRDPNGVPLSNAKVFSWRANPTNTWFDGFFTTDAAGAYVVTATLGTHYLLAFHNDYALSSTQTVALTGNATGVDMQVTAGIAAGGTLTGSDGRSLRWADVNFETGSTNGRFNRHGVVYYNGAWRSTFAAGSYTINVTQPYYSDQSQTLTVAPSPAPINFNLVRETQRLVGRITNTAGGGLCDAYVTATNTSTNLSSYANSTSDGDYAVMLAPGTYNVWPYKYRSNSPDFTNQITVPPVPASLNYRLTEVFFQDVPRTAYYFVPVGYLIYSGIASGYSDGTYRPNNNTTRGQLTKLIVLGEAWTLLNPPTPTFSDVSPDNVFYQFVETAYSHGVISGYSNGTFGWGNNVTRAQLSKIVVLAEGWPTINPPNPTFSDVPQSSPFYAFIETAFSRGIVSGYNDGTFRPGNSATRAQIAKIVYNALTAP